MAAVRIDDRFGHRVRGIAFGCGGDVQQRVLGHMLGVDGVDRKYALGQRAGLVKDDGVHAGERLQIVGALNQNALARSAADPAEKGQRTA